MNAPSTQATEVLGLGMDSQLWPVAANYKIQDGIVKPIGDERHRLYVPAVEPRLFWALAKVEDEREESALDFVRQFGLLGHSTLVPQHERTGGDPLNFIYSHARTLRDVLALSRALRLDDRDDIKDAVSTIFSQPQSSDDVLASLSRRWRWQDGVHDMVTLIPDDLDDSDAAAQAIARAISGNLIEIHPRVYVRSSSNPSETSERRSLEFSLNWRSLTQVCFWGLYFFLRSGRPLAICEECGIVFPKTDSRQRFCPPAVSGMSYARAHGRRPQSKCGLRKRTRRSKQRRLEK